MPPYQLQYGQPSYEVCPCCGFEFGNDDEPGTARPTSFDDYRRDWIASGAEWFDPAARPNGWSFIEQLRQAGITLGG